MISIASVHHCVVFGLWQRFARQWHFRVVHQSWNPASWDVIQLMHNHPWDLPRTLQNLEGLEWIVQRHAWVSLGCQMHSTAAILGTSQNPSTPTKTSKVTNKWLSGSSRSDSKVALKVTTWPEKYMFESLFGFTCHVWGHLWVTTQKSLLVTFALLWMLGGGVREALASSQDRNSTGAFTKEFGWSWRYPDGSENFPLRESCGSQICAASIEGGTSAKWSCPKKVINSMPKMVRKTWKRIRKTSRNFSE